MLPILTGPVDGDESREKSIVQGAGFAMAFFLTGFPLNQRVDKGPGMF